MPAMETVLRHCSSCAEEREFEAPPCDDGHGLDCPELACLGCGEALVTDAPQITAPANIEPANIELPTVGVPAFVHHAA